MQSAQGSESLSNIGTGYYFLRDYTSAQDMYKKAIEFSKDDHRLWGNLADAQRMSGQDEAAAENYLKAIELAMNQHAINDGDAMNLSRLAVYHAALGNHANAVEFLQLAQAAGEGNPYVLYDVVVVWVLLDSEHGSPRIL